MANTIDVNEWMRFGPEYIENFGTTTQTLKFDRFLDSGAWEHVNTVQIPASETLRLDSLRDGLYRVGYLLTNPVAGQDPYRYYMFPHFPSLAKCLGNYQSKLSKEFFVRIIYYLRKANGFFRSQEVDYLLPDLEVVKGHNIILQDLLFECEECERYCRDNPEDCVNQEATNSIS